MAFPEMMRAIRVEGGRGPASALKLVQVSTPAPNADQLLIKVHAAGVNRPDLLQRLGAYPPPPGVTDILGLEIAGEVVHPAGRHSVGDKVCALIPGGGYAEYVVCDPRHALPIPAGLSFEAAASLPETVFTVYTNVFEDGQLQSGQTFLVHGANSGIGVTAIQMAKAAGAVVIATARGPAKTRYASELGADEAVDVLVDDFAAVAQRRGGADVILEMIGGPNFEKDLQALKPRGRIVFIAALAGRDVTLPVFVLMHKRAVVTGSTLRPRDANEKARLAKAVEQTVWPWIADGRLKPMVSKVFPLEQAADAHAYLESGDSFGKTVLALN